jgi:hypothetical protein
MARGEEKRHPAPGKRKQQEHQARTADSPVVNQTGTNWGGLDKRNATQFPLVEEPAASQTPSNLDLRPFSNGKPLCRGSRKGLGCSAVS